MSKAKHALLPLANTPSPGRHVVPGTSVKGKSGMSAETDNVINASCLFESEEVAYFCFKR